MLQKVKIPQVVSLFFYPIHIFVLHYGIKFDNLLNEAPSVRFGV